MRKDMVWSGVAIVFLGALLVLVGGILNFVAYQNLVSGDADEIVEVYNALRKGELLISIGLFVAFLGIALGISGMALQEPETETETPAQDQWEQPHEQPPGQYPPGP